MKPSFQQYLLFGLGGVWCVLILMHFSTANAPQEVPLTFVSGKPVASTRAAIGAQDPWQVKRIRIQAHEMPMDRRRIFSLRLENQWR
jgi:hypothetical protein